MPKVAAKKRKSDAVRSVSLVSLGCPKNLVDSEKMLGMLAESGLAPVSYDPTDENSVFQGADAVVINTCGFLEASKDESLQVIQEAIREKEKGNIKRVVVAGCLVQRHRAKMLEWAPGIDAMVGVFDRDKIVEAVVGTQAVVARAGSMKEASDGPKYWIAANALAAAKARDMSVTGLTVNGKDGKGIGYFEDDSARLRLTPRHYAYLRISEGCNQNCAFCTIPSIRGKMRSKPLDRIVEEARELINDGAFELLLIGQDTTSYGDDIGLGLTAKSEKRKANSGTDFSAYGGLPTLLQALSETMDDANHGQGWLRLMYAYPTNFSDPIIEAFATLAQKGRLLPYLDIPLQHASDRVLELMKRNVTKKQQGNVIKKLREKTPGMSVRTTFISGFPGETESDHKQLLEFIEEMDFEAVGVFEYSHEAGTVAGTMEGDRKLAVPQEVKTRRRNEVMELQQKLAFAKAEKMAKGFDEKNPEASIKKGATVLDVVIDAGLRTSGQKTSGVGAGGRLYQGRTRFQAPQIDAVTYVQSRDKLASGEVVRCVVVGSDGYDLIAKPVTEIEKRVGLKVLR
ncbi:MAG: 30S ribosomal protein S12 methylthiotransferase RimO [Phycisphaerae bacterium]|nr:30S ribosomal protein S12 methylthiotransferase RimO [Phycisphaerae bacterium]